MSNSPTTTNLPVGYTVKEATDALREHSKTVHGLENHLNEWFCALVSANEAVLDDGITEPMTAKQRCDLAKRLIDQADTLRAFAKKLDDDLSSWMPELIMPTPPDHDTPATEK